MNFLRILFLLALVVLPDRSFAQGGHWNLPIEIDTSNTEVVFSLGTTWHTVTGIAKRVDGRIWLNDSADFTSVEGRSTIAVRDLDSDNSLRDEKMRDVMDEERFNDITVHLKEVTKICDPAKMQLNETCEIVLLCDLTIRDITKEVVVAGNIALSEKGYIVTAAVDLEWAEFGIEDPSILVARVEKKVSVSVRVSLKNP